MINTTYRACLDADVLYAADGRWWRYHGADVKRKFTGECWTQQPRVQAGETPRHPDNQAEINEFNLQWVYGQDEPGLGSYDIHYGGNSGYQAINLAYRWGASKIILLGYDMSVEPQDDGSNKVHWHGDHPPQLNNGSNLYPGWVRNFERLASDLSHVGVEVINCSRRTALTCFPQRTVEEICEQKN